MGYASEGKSCPYWVESEAIEGVRVSIRGEDARSSGDMRQRERQVQVQVQVQGHAARQSSLPHSSRSARRGMARRRAVVWPAGYVEAQGLRPAFSSFSARRPMSQSMAMSAAITAYKRLDLSVSEEDV